MFNHSRGRPTRANRSMQQAGTSVRTPPNQQAGTSVRTPPNQQESDERVLINEKRNGVRLTATLRQSYKFRESARVWVYTICMEKATALDTLREGSLTSVKARETGDITLWKEYVLLEYEGPESDKVLMERTRELIQKKRALINDIFAL